MRLLLSRLLWAAAILCAVVTLSFVLVRSLPGGPFDESRALDPVIRANLMAAYDLQAPLPEGDARRQRHMNADRLTAVGRRAKEHRLPEVVHLRQVPRPVGVRDVVEDRCQDLVGTDSFIEGVDEPLDIRAGGDVVPCCRHVDARTGAPKDGTACRRSGSA